MERRRSSMFVINLAAMAAMLGPEVTRASPPSPPTMALFPKDEVPGERPGAIGPEKDLNDTVGHIYNVTIPTITPYLASNPSASAAINQRKDVTVLSTPTR